MRLAPFRRSNCYMKDGTSPKPTPIHVPYQDSERGNENALGNIRIPGGGNQGICNFGEMNSCKGV